MGGALLAACLLAGGCVAHLEGVVYREDGVLRLQTPEGRDVRLVARGEAAPVARLEDHVVHVEGRRLPGGLRISDWKVHTGLHGLSTWVGRLEVLGLRVGLRDRNSGAFYVLAPDSAEALRPWAGEVVLVEGYVQGPHEVRAMYYRVLTGDTGDPP